MAFDQKTRNLLQRTVSSCRNLLDAEFAAQRRSIFGINDDGTAAPLETLSHLSDEDMQTARLLRDRLDQLFAGLVSQGKKEAEARKEAVGRVTREQAFTVLNRLAALRMSEEREIVLECVRQGTASEGFQLFMQSAGGALGSNFESYRAYLFLLFDELAIDLGVLFSRWDPAGLLFPRQEALETVLRELNGTGTAATREDITPEAFNGIWAEDETIGWIYQYYNDQAERKKMRDESSAPRNSRELAVRNQFFTPRYVVEFLTDNTLGRIWYEMTKGQTRLKDQCRYLVRRPTEIFLAIGEAPPAPNQEPGTKNEELSQENLLKQPVHIPHRPLKDPRTILMLDPACGSMHFGLYAFDLFEVIYDETWALEEKLGADALSRPPGMKSLHDTYAGQDAFRKDIPRLIIEHNIHGIDIDPRAAQIAGLALWLRAQKAWQQLGLKQADRPVIRRSNIVYAEPMPGEKELLREFVEREFPAAERGECLKLLNAIFDKMQLAGEAGSLLKIEEEIRSAIEDARDAWQKLATKPQELFTTTELNQLSTGPELTGLELAVSSLTTAPRHLTTEFWARLEERIYAALRDYAEQAENGGGFQRRLFAEDAARGFAFIDVCRKRYDVVMMNPPFGDCSPAIKTYLNKVYRDNAVELYCAFADRGFNLLHSAGFIGCITSSSFVLYNEFSGYRELLLQQQCLEHLANLGDSVLDGAYVYTASYILRKAPPAQLIAFYDLRIESAKAEALQKLVRWTGGHTLRLFSPRRFSLLASSPLCHWASDSLFSLAENAPSLGTVLEDSGLGAAPQADFFNLWWEVPPDLISLSQRWVRIANGGAFSPYHRADYLVVDWKDNGKRAVADINHRYPYLNGNVGMRIQRTHLYGRPGITYGKRTDRFNAQVLAADQMFTFEGIGVFPENKSENYVLGLLAYLNSRFVAYYLNLTAGLHKNDIYVCRLPFPLHEKDVLGLAEYAKRALPLVVSALAVEEAHPLFSGVFLGETSEGSIRNLAVTFKKRDRIEEARYFEAISAIEDSVSRLCGLDAELLREVEKDQGFDIARSSQRIVPGSSATSKPERERPGFCRSGFEKSSDLYRCCINKEISPSDAVNQLNTSNYIEVETVSWFVGSSLSYGLGVAFGRWDIRYATGEQAAPELPDPFAPLPVCPPGQLKNAQGLPARPEDVPAAYPVRIPWDGILVDDPNHPLDIERRVREVIEIIWSGQEGGPTAEAIEHEACEILGVKSLRDYFRKPASFFADHLKRYSKSRRQAPIYWPLSTASGSYTLWIYYHRLTPDTLYKCLQQFVEPKIKDVEQDIHRLRTMLSSDEGGSKERDQLKNAETLLNELKEMHAELTLWAPKWKPNLNDGVLITASPLWKFFRLPKWRKDLEACWKELEAGDYDWAHHAHTLWPTRVREKCKKDRSLAIAHGLEELCEIKAPEPKKRATKKVKQQTEQMDLE
jgi:hypothetical protein